MNAIFKYICPPNVCDWVTQLPKGAQILSIGKQDLDYVFWASVDPLAPHVPHRLLLVPTGQAHSYLDNPKTRFVGTLQDEFEGRYFVLHLFDLGELS